MKCTLQTGSEIAHQVEQANTFWARLKGLMFRRKLAVQTGLLLDPCPQIHTCFMRFNIDVIFVDKNNRVIAVMEHLKPWRMTKFYTCARRVLELPEGTLQGRVHIGDELIFN